MVLTCEQMTVKHSIYTWKVPFLCTERACVVFSGIKILPRRKMTWSEVLQVLQTRGSILHTVFFKNQLYWTYKKDVRLLNRNHVITRFLGLVVVMSVNIV